MMEYILAIDQGTSGSKAIVFSAAGEPAASHICPLKSSYPKPGFVEQDGEEIIESVMGAVTAAVARFEEAGFSRESITACGISNQRESFLLWDRQGKALSPVVVWQCKRSIDVCARLEAEGNGAHLHDITGLRLDPYFSGTKLRCLIDGDADLAAKIKTGSVYFGTIDTWLLYKLTGGKSFISDYTNASRTLLMDLDTCAWSQEMADMLSAPGLQLAELRPSSGNFGSSTFGSVFNKPIPITSIIGDSHAACFGEGCFAPGTVKATMGTGSSVVMNTGKRAHSKHGMVSTVCWSMEGRLDYALEGVIVSCGSTITWIQEKLGLVSDPKEFDTLAASVGDSGGVTFIPAFSGLGGPWWQMERQAEIRGITFGTEAAHIIRAALESYPFQLKDVISAMEQDQGAALKWIKADGGLTRSTISMQMIADLLRTDVTIDKRLEASALGAALLGFIGKGTLSFTDAEQVIQHAGRDQYHPRNLDKSLELSYTLWNKRIKEGFN
ncbi:glycerol kinase [Spirochaetia bacterium]|nr:glycerol kinase [Spirochaetia bacterium]